VRIVRTPAKISSEQALYTAAIGALSRRAHSVFEMRTYLERRAAERESAKRVLARLRENRLLDDARYALEFARHRAQVRRQGRHRIARELRVRGVQDQHIEAAVAQVFAENDEATIVRTMIERRVRALRGPFDARKAISLYRSLIRGGFDAALIRRELNAFSAASAAELPEADAGDEAG
jgi:regulatory protein